MKYGIYIDQLFCLEYGITNLTEAAIFSTLYSASSWADPVVIGGQIFYHVSRNKVISEIPLAAREPDTVYRALKKLEQKGVIIYRKDGKKDLVQLTEWGRTWNSEKNPSFEDDPEKNPSFPGKKSEKGSDFFPTDNNTNTHKSTSNESAPFDREMIFEDFLTKLEEINAKGPKFWAAWETEKFVSYYQRKDYKSGRTKIKNVRLAITNWIKNGMERRVYLRSCPNDPEYLTNGSRSEKANGHNSMDHKIALAYGRATGYAPAEDLEKGS